MREREGAGPEFFTIGVYGFTADSFFAALVTAGVDLFCDIRRRRGVRGAEYAFANANRLQAGLKERGIGYLHRLELAPSLALRSAEQQQDRRNHTAKRQRVLLSDSFQEGYRKECLADFDSTAFVASLGNGFRRVVFCCVEREPGACHRSLLAERLEADLGVPVTHLRPPAGGGSES